MKKLTLQGQKSIQSKIYSLRGVRIMLDRDLAELYEVKAIRLREQVKRNKKRCPSDFMFQLNSNEVDFMVSQNAIPSKKHLGGNLPYAFTEQGAASISGILTSKIAVQVNIKIMRAFVQMRKVLASNSLMFQKIETIEQKQLKTDKKVNNILNAIKSKDIQPKQQIFFEGKVFDAHTLLSKIIKSANKEIILIDNYIDESVLLLLSKRKKKCKSTIYTKSISKVLRLDLQKHNKQYSEIKIKLFKKSHDRFLIIDNKEVYHIGASLKDLGKKWFAISKFERAAFSILSKLK